MSRCRPGSIVLLAAALLACSAAKAAAQQIVLFSLPTSVGFNVTDVSRSTPGNPDPTTVSFTIVNLSLFHVLRVSLKADADFTPPAGASIPASRISWTASSTSQVTGGSGTMSTAAFTELFETNGSLLGAGSVDVRWTLAPPGAGILAGTHTATIRWRLESVVP